MCTNQIFFPNKPVDANSTRPAQPVSFFPDPLPPPSPLPNLPFHPPQERKEEEKKRERERKKKLKSWEGEHEKGNRELQNRGGLIRDVAKLEDGR